jgi:hypothetical protein
MNRLLVLFAAFLLSCRGCPPPPSPTGDASLLSTATVTNRTGAQVTVYVSFGANSQINAKDWPFCKEVPSGCKFDLAPSASQDLPSYGEALNVSLSFSAPAGCGVSLAEVNFNIPGWSQDTANISLVNGWNRDLEIDVADAETLGPTNGPDANSGVYGVFPVACDLCVSRGDPPCGYDAGGCTKAGSCGCKSGTQYNPTPPCQESFARGSNVTVALVTEVPAML